MVKYRVEATLRISYETDGASPDEAKAAAWLMAASGSARLVDVSSAAAVEVTAEQQLATRNLQFWLESEAVRLQATAEDRKRFIKGTLGDEALAVYARVELFAGWGPAIVRWAPRPYTDVRHANTCHGERSVIARTLPGRAFRPRELREAEQDTLAAISTLAARINSHPWLQKTGESVGVEVRWHVLSCDQCAATAAKPSVMVTIPWGERMLSREYAL